MTCSRPRWIFLISLFSLCGVSPMRGEIQNAPPSSKIVAHTSDRKPKAVEQPRSRAIQERHTCVKQSLLYNGVVSFPWLAIFILRDAKSVTLKKVGVIGVRVLLGVVSGFLAGGLQYATQKPRWVRNMVLFFLNLSSAFIYFLIEPNEAAVPHWMIDLGNTLGMFLFLELTRPFLWQRDQTLSRLSLGKRIHLGLLLSCSTLMIWLCLSAALGPGPMYILQTTDTYNEFWTYVYLFLPAVLYATVGSYVIGFLWDTLGPRPWKDAGEELLYYGAYAVSVLYILNRYWKTNTATIYYYYLLVPLLHRSLMLCSPYAKSMFDLLPAGPLTTKQHHV